MAYLTPDVRRRRNLTVLGGVTVDTVLIEDRTARGIVTASGTVYPAGEVVLAAGAYGSPSILLRSGIGPAADLRALGIDVVADLPVGRRLQDHPFFHALYALSPDHQAMTEEFGAHLWFASYDAAPGELDMSVVSTQLPQVPFSPTGGAILLATAVTRAGVARLPDTGLPGSSPRPGHRQQLPRYAERPAAACWPASSSYAPWRPPSPSARCWPANSSPGTPYRATTSWRRRSRPAYPPTATRPPRLPMGGPGDEWAVVDELGAVKDVERLRGRGRLDHP